ncbi:MAG TPA: cation:proton antiporter [Candidatus Cloacimonetes bacterium]|nr:cation:proton antiporter [Candidatus Cloacimonadota bacterium]HEX38103.1 cation:proton antiporter [Candidatus Cloacimonadota bacterium]
MILYIMCFFLFLVGIYGAITKRDLIKIILAIGIMGYSVNLFLVLLAYRSGALIPILVEGLNIPPNMMVDPIPQALVLTSIVIELGITALMAALAIRIYQKYDTFDITKIRRLQG